MIPGLVVLLFSPTSSLAQSQEVQDPFFAKIGIGFSDYTGDFPAQNVGHPLDFQDFVRGTGFPFTNTSELGYQFSSSKAVVLGLQVGNYPIVGYAGDTGLKDSYRYTLQLMGRYTFDIPSWSVSPYADVGANVTFSGLKTGYGPTVGGGVSVPIDRSVSFFVESRFNFTYPDDAIDGSADAPNGSTTGPFDSLNQLLGFGVRVNFGGSSDAESTAPPTPSPLPSRTEPTKISAMTSRGATADTSRFEEAVRIPSGTFIMGLTDEDPLSIQNAGRKRVTVSAFYLDQYEVTNAEYREYLSQLSPEKRKERLPDSTAWNKARTQESWDTYFRSERYAEYPVVAVTWSEAQAYCKAQNMRLPTEAEWEYAARAGHTGRVYPWNGLGTRDQEGQYLANFKPSEGYSIDGYAFTAPVDTMRQNQWHLYNMSGNVAEWTRDAYTPLYDDLSDFNPYHTDEDEPRRIVRGGAWNSTAHFIGVGVRDAQPKDQASVDVGFRCVRELTSRASAPPADSSSSTARPQE